MVEAIQRWRIAFRRGEPALGLGPAEIARAWESGLAGSAIPIVLSAAATPRPKLTFASPLPAGRPAEHDLADLVLGERWPLARLRPALAAALPDGFEVVDLYDVWLGAPALAAALSATSHRARLRGASSDELGAAAEELMAATSLSRSRARSDGRVSYDLRPLILDLASRPAGPTGDEAAGRPADGAAGAILRVILRSASDGPAGRPDEVILALGEHLGRTLELVDLVRERLWTADELPVL
jgi:radical SAM-linked protein